MLAEIVEIEEKPQPLDDQPKNPFTNPNDGTDPKIWSHYLKLSPFSFMSTPVYEQHKITPEVPPPTYDKYEDVIKPRPNANEKN